MYLQKLAKSLGVEIEKYAALKLARLATGSMRDAVTYFDQCYAMAGKTISLNDVEKNLGLISDADLDEIINAIKDKNRTALSEALSVAFRSGLSAVPIAEALISRLRDREFYQLKKRNDTELNFVENLSEEVRKIILEMQYSGIPDIIFEMALMKMTAPPISNQPELPTEKIPAQDISIDDVKRCFHELRMQLPEKEKNLIAILSSANISNFVDNVLTLSFSSATIAGMFNDTKQAQFEKLFSQKINCPVKVIKVLDNNAGNLTLNF